MTEGIKDTLDKLIALSEIDSNISVHKARKDGFLEEIKVKEKELVDLKADYQKKALAYTEKKARFDKEEKYLKGERLKLIERRKSLASLSSYKLQTAAEREIEVAAQQIGSQEEALIGMLGDIDTLQSGSDESKAALESKVNEYNEWKTQVNDQIEGIDVQNKDRVSKRDEIVKDVDENSLRLYERLYQRYSNNPVVPLNGTMCSGCFLDLGPQLINQIGKADKIVQCRSCNRILFLKPASDTTE